MDEHLYIIQKFSCQRTLSPMEKSVARALLKEAPERGGTKNAAGESPIHVAGEHGNRDLVEILLDADPRLAEIHDFFGNTIVHTATVRKDFSILEACIKANPRSLLVRTLYKGQNTDTGLLPVELCRDPQTISWLKNQMKMLSEFGREPSFSPCHP
ncbi:MAG TPA: hypothetical protein DCW68_04690 [Rhodospirillaceae bacterium]|nr:MAG: hypothetical protein A2018_02955 [Alphaproteobacteria bacterium GWF2_58_20]HAU29393.1 hypothetical protein [Rhodospirillaceae bacterium]